VNGDEHGEARLRSYAYVLSLAQTTSLALRYEVSLAPCAASLAAA
jgi:hypothetical protein